MNFYEIAQTRQSCRSYDAARPVEDKKIAAILETARLSPSACNGQPYHFTVCRGETAKGVAKATQGMGMNKFASDAPVLIVISEKPYVKTAALGAKVKGKVAASSRHKLNPEDKLIRDLNGREATPHEYLLKSGSSEECIDIAIMAEGYTDEEMATFMEDAHAACDEIMRYEPFASHKHRFNVVAVKCPSKQSDVSVPQDASWKQTAVNSNFMTFYSPRYLTTNSVHLIHDQLIGIDYEHLIILANTDTYGGGGIYNSYTLTTAHNPYFKPVVVHEFGHSFGGLGDEYFYEQPDHTENFYSLDYEPWEQNITSLVDFDSKWKDMLDKGEKIPAEPTEKRQKRYTVGVYEGGGYMTKGMYRPAVICRMRDNVATQFCPVCQRAIERIILYNTNEE